MKFGKFFRTHFFTEHLRWLLLGMEALYLVKLEVTFFIKKLKFITKALNDTGKEEKFANTGKQNFKERPTGIVIRPQISIFEICPGLHVLKFQVF